MKISSSYNQPQFKSRCPEIKMGQNICHLINSEFPHYSMTKYSPLIDKHIGKVKHPFYVMRKIENLESYRPYPQPEYIPRYFDELFHYIDKYHAFNCGESALLSELILKLNGIKNVYTACVRDGNANENHVVCLFNKDGSEIVINGKDKKYSPKIENNKTIIIDPWTGICDFANNALKELCNVWSEYLKPYLFKNQANGTYNLINTQSADLPEGFLDALRDEYPKLILKKSE